MRILKSGNRFTVRSWVGFRRCYACDCQFQFGADDIQLFGAEQIHYVKCPECGTALLASVGTVHEVPEKILDYVRNRWSPDKQYTRE